MKLPVSGERIPAENIHVSRFNVRVAESFGDNAEDLLLIAQLKEGKKIVQPFKLRPEQDGFGVFVGRRRFLAKKAAGFTEFVVGQDCIIEDIEPNEALEESLLEGFDVLRKTTNPVTRARRLEEIVKKLTIRGAAAKLGIPKSNLDDWLQVLRLTPEMQKLVEEGKMQYVEALRLARAKVPEPIQQGLAQVLESEGEDAFKRELAKASGTEERRGIPKGKYDVLRLTFDKTSSKDEETLSKLQAHAEQAKKVLPEFLKDEVIPFYLANRR